MMQLTNLLFAFLVAAFYTCCAMLMVKLLPKAVEKPLWVKVTCWGAYAALTVLLPTLFRDDIVTMTTLTAVYLLFGWYAYHRSRIGLVYQLAYMALMYVSELIAIFLAVNLAAVLEAGNIIFVYMVCVLKLFFMFTVLLLIKRILRNRSVTDGTGLKLGGMAVVPLFSMAALFLYVIGGEVFFARYGYGWIILYCVLILVINLYCLYFWYDVASSQELKHKLELTQQQNELTHQYYADMEDSYNKSRKIIHDIRNHISALEQAAKLGRAEVYAGDVHEMLNSLGLKFYCENRMLNIVMNDKLKNLSPGQFECHMSGVCLNFLSDMDVTTIFANLLDNALEAGEGEEGFWLKIRGEQIQDFTAVRIWNRCREGYVPGCSNKKGHEGLGLENAGQAVRKYHGEIKIECKDSVFAVTVVFPGRTDNA